MQDRYFQTYRPQRSDRPRSPSGKPWKERDSAGATVIYRAGGDNALARARRVLIYARQHAEQGRIDYAACLRESQEPASAEEEREALALLAEMRPPTTEDEPEESPEEEQDRDDDDE